LLGLAVFLVFLASWPPSVWLSVLTLEHRYRAAMPPAKTPAEAIVVLSGYMKENDWGGDPSPGLDTYERLLYARALHERWPRVPIVVSGGKILAGSELPVSTVMARYLTEQGVPADRILEESKARNTYDNARFSAGLLRDRGLNRIALVTEARHMLRAELTFRKQGLDVVPAPCCFASDLEWEWGLLVPAWWSLETMEGVVHEWLGLAAYRARGWL